MKFQRGSRGGWIRTAGVVLLGLGACGASSSGPNRSNGIRLNEVPRASLHGSYRSKCTPLKVDGEPFYSVLRINFRLAEKGARAGLYSSEETAYQDAECLISVFQGNTKGRFDYRHGALLNLVPTRMTFTPLSSRMSERLNMDRTCGHTWIYGEPREVLGTACARIEKAQYLLSKTASGIDFYECEGQTAPNADCTVYSTTREKKRTL